MAHPVRVQVGLRWGDLDPYGHINNVELIRILEEARARGFWQVARSPESTVADLGGILPPLDPDEPTWALIADLSVRYLLPLPYSREPVTVEMTIDALKGASFVIAYRVLAGPEPRLHAAARTTVVTVDRDTGAPRRLTPEIRAALLLHLTG